MTLATDALVAYEATAPHYDLFTADHEHEPWTDTLERVAVEAGMCGRRLLDVGCGTGKSFLPFLARGYLVTACDISPAMLAIAAGKCGGRDVRLSVQDVRTLPRLGEFDLVCCLADALNYLLEPEELTDALRAMADNLAPGGMLLFDLNTLRAYRTFFATRRVVQEDGRVLVWEGRAAPDADAGELAEASLEALTRQPAGDWTRSTALHRQRHHPEPLVREALAEAGLEAATPFGVSLDGMLTRPLDERHHTKALYLTRERRKGR
jgi:SAM-dependent methyltransferase